MPHSPRRSRCVLAAALLMSIAANAQDPAVSTPPPPTSLPQQFVTDTLDVWRTPFRRETYKDGSLTKYILPFAMITTGLVIADRKIADQMPNTASQTQWSGRVSQLGASYTTAGFAAATFFTGQLAGNDKLRETGILSLEALAQSQLLVFAAKQFTNRQRPVDGDGHGSFWEGGNSFPSGHAAAAFAVASVFSQEYSDHRFVPFLAYSTAGLIAVSRPGARRHWMSDIVVGSTTGYLLGKFVYRRHHNRRLDQYGSAKPSPRIPQIGFTGSGFGLGWNW